MYRLIELRLLGSKFLVFSSFEVYSSCPSEVKQGLPFFLPEKMQK